MMMMMMMMMMDQINRWRSNTGRLAVSIVSQHLEGCGRHACTKALWQISDEHFAEALELPPRSSAVQGQNVAARGAESMRQGFTQILNNVEVQGEYDIKIHTVYIYIHVKLV